MVRKLLTSYVFHDFRVWYPALQKHPWLVRLKTEQQSEQFPTIRLDVVDGKASSSSKMPSSIKSPHVAMDPEASWPPEIQPSATQKSGSVVLPRVSRSVTFSQSGANRLPAKFQVPVTDEPWLREETALAIEKFLEASFGAKPVKFYMQDDNRTREVTLSELCSDPASYETVNVEVESWGWSLKRLKFW